MNKKINLAIIGASGLVGRTLLKVLEEKNNLQIHKLYLFASEKSKGKKLSFRNKEYTIENLSIENIINKKIDFALFSAGASISKIFAPKFAQIGAIVIDNSSAFRMDKKVPLIVPQVNFHDVSKFDSIIANPNCSTIQCTLPLKALQKFGLKEIHFTTYQAVSGSGIKGLEDLKNTSDGNPPNFYTIPIHNNVIPQIDDFLENGYTKEEMKMVNETKKILHLNRTKISATCVRVPIENSHSVEILVRLKMNLNISQIKKQLENFPQIKVVDDISDYKYPYPTMATGNDYVYVGRIRKCPDDKKLLHLFCVSDNIRKGAASNAIEILEKLI